MQPGAPSTFRRILVEDAGQLAMVIRELAGADAVGLDVEMAQRIERLPGGVTRGRQLLALVQLAGVRTSLVVDPRAVKDLTPLAPLMASNTVKVVLGGATDIQLLEERGLTVRNVADLAEMAAATFGHKEEGMRALAGRALGIEIEKSIRRENWMRRPIRPAMLSYAHRDAELTLLLYRWFQEHHPEVVLSHVRQNFHPTLASSIPSWIRKFLTKRLDAQRLLKEEGIDVEAQRGRLVEDVRTAERHDLSPGQQRRLIRLIGELGFSELYDDVVPYASSPSSIFRSSAARALGRLGQEEARPVLERLKEDVIADVQAAAEVALRDLEAALNPAPTPPVPATSEDDEAPTSLDAEALAALQLLRSSLNGAPEPPPAKGAGS